MKTFLNDTLIETTFLARFFSSVPLSLGAFIYIFLSFERLFLYIVPSFKLFGTFRISSIPLVELSVAIVSTPTLRVLYIL